MVEAGEKLGVGFQIHDDILNLSADPSRYGKEIGDDLLEGKRTLIILHLLQRAAGGEREKLLSIMNKARHEKSKADVAFVLSMVDRYDAVGYARKRASELMKEAVRILRGIKWEGDRDAVALLEAFARFAVEREW